MPEFAGKQQWLIFAYPRLLVRIVEIKVRRRTSRVEELTVDDFTTKVS